MQPQEPPKLPRTLPTKKMGRPSQHNVEALRLEWLESGLTPYSYLCAKGLQKNGALRDAARLWVEPTLDGEESAMASKTKLMRAKHYDAIIEAIEAAKKESVPDVNALWSLYMRWRTKQSAADYLTADKIRQHLRILLDNGLSEDGTATKYNPQELARIAGVAESVQKIQRLALGMSTENVGMESPQTHVEKEAQTIEAKEGEPQEAQLPVFVVEMSRGGKFVRSRPTMQLAKASAG